MSPEHRLLALFGRRRFWWVFRRLGRPLRGTGALLNIWQRLWGRTRHNRKRIAHFTFHVNLPSAARRQEIVRSAIPTMHLSSAGSQRVRITGYSQDACLTSSATMSADDSPPFIVVPRPANAGSIRHCSGQLILFVPVAFCKLGRLSRAKRA